MARAEVAIQREHAVYLPHELLEAERVAFVFLDERFTVQTTRGLAHLQQMRESGHAVFAKLPRGPYTVEATYDGSTQVRKIDLRERLRTEYMRRPSNPDNDFPGPKATEKE